MKVTTNNTTVVAENTTPSGLNLRFTTPVPGVKAVSTLKIRQGKNTVNLTTSQIDAVRRVISAGKRKKNTL